MQRFLTFVLAALPAVATTITDAGISGFGTTTVSANAIAFYVSGFGPPDPASITANAQAIGFTLGPVRDGFIQITGTGSGEFGNGSGFVGAYSFGCSATCFPPGYLSGAALPFTLGVPFQVDVSAFATSFGTGSGNISYHFSLFESFVFNPTFAAVPGASVTVYDAASLPEPATFAPVGLALLWLAIHASRRLRRPNSN